MGLPEKAGGLEAMERKYDVQFKGGFSEAIRELIEPPPDEPKRRIGFKDR